jgi:hypothetical protein
MMLAAVLAACGEDPIVAGSTTAASTGTTQPGSTTDTPTSTTGQPTTGTTGTDGVSASSSGNPGTTGAGDTTTTGGTTGTGTTGTGDTTTTGDTTNDTTTTGGTTDDTTTGGTTGGTTDPFACIEPTDSDTAADPSGWTRVHGQADQYLLTRQVAVAPDGSVVIGFRFRGSLDLGDGPIDTGGAYHWVLARYGAGGELQWSTHLGGDDDGTSIEHMALALDCGGNLVIGGAFDGPIKLQGKTLQVVPGFWQEADIIYGTSDMFLAQYGADGQLRWARRFGDSAWQRIHDLDLQSDGTIVIGGANRGTLELGGAALVANNKFDGVLAAFDPDGALLWQRNYPGPSDVAVELLAVGPGGRIAAYGHAGDVVDLGGGELPYTGIYKWVGGFEADGAHRWSRRFLDATHQAVHIGADAGGGLVLAGDRDPPGSVLDGFVVRYDDTGLLSWYRQFDPAPAPAESLQIGALAVGDEITIAGQLKGDLDLGGGAVNSPVKTTFRARYDLAGANLGSTLFPGSDDTRPYSGAYGPDGELVLGGMFKGKLDLGAGPTMSVGKQDMFVHRFGP